MSRAIHGRATLHGIDGDVTFSAIVSGTVLEPQSAEYGDEFEKVEAKDAKGEVIGVTTFNPKQTLNLTLLPLAGTSTDNTLVKAAAALQIPGNYKVITLSNFDHTNNNGTWNYAGGARLSQSNTGLPALTLPLERYAGAAFSEVSS